MVWRRTTIRIVAIEPISFLGIVLNSDLEYLAV